MFQVNDAEQFLINDDDFRVEWFSGTGAGGQHRNKSQNSCRVIHIPTGISESRQSRSREGNFREAKSAVLNQLRSIGLSEKHKEFAADKKSKLGSGMRGDKFITIQFQNDRVTHHRTNKTCRVKDFMNGRMDLIF